MAVGRGRRRRPNHRPGGAGAVYCAAPHEDRAVGPVPPSGVAGPGHPTRRGPDGGVPRGWRNPTVRLSLSPLPFFFSPYLLAQVPCRRGSPSPAPMEGRPGSGVDGRESPRQGGGVGRCYSRSPRSLHANSLSPFPPLGWRGSLGRPAGVAGTRATLLIVVR